MDRLLSELRTEGRVDSCGRFTLDLARALEKMQRYQLAEPRAFVLNLIAGATLTGAERIDLSLEAGLFRMEWDGRPLTMEDVLGLFDPFDRQTPPAVSELSIGLSACRGLDLLAMQVESSRVRLQLDRSSLTIEPRQCEDRNRIVVREKVPLWRRFTGPDRRIVAFLEERCSQGPVKIFLEGRPLNVSVQAHNAEAQVELEDLRALVALVRLPRSQPTFTVILNQVSFVLEDTGLEYPGAVVIAQAQGLRKELSQSTLVRDQALQQLIDRVAVELDRLALGLMRENAPSYHAHLEPLIRRLRRRLGPTELSGRNVALGPWTELAHEFWDLPVLSRADGSLASLGEVLPIYVRTGYLPVTQAPQERSRELEDGSVVMLRPTGPAADVLDTFFPDQALVHFSTEGCHLTGERGLSPRLPPDRYLARRFLTGLPGELGVAARPPLDPPQVFLTRRDGDKQVLDPDEDLLPRGLVVVARPGPERLTLLRATAARLPELYAALDWGREHFPEVEERELARAHLREAAVLAIRQWRKAGRPTPSPRDFLFLRMHEGGPEIRFIDPDLLDEALDPTDDVTRQYRC
ncbi:MAG: hypothetical protein AMXMBFR33_21910 [Candidatus Xenobia bacterium]